MAHVSESCHWYDRHGTPVYEVPSADGKRMVKTTLAHARKLNLVPGITAILSCAHKPALETWKVKQAILAALTLPRNDGESDDDYVKRVMTDSQEEARIARDRGTDVHALLEGYYAGEQLPTLTVEDEKTLQAVTELVASVCGEQPWRAEYSFAHPLGYGSKADLVCDDWLIDFKGSDFPPEQEMKTWPDHWMQLAATDAGIGVDLASLTTTRRRRRCCILYFSRSHPGAVAIVEVTKEQLEKGWEMFSALHRFWCVTRDFDPSFEEQIA